MKTRKTTKYIKPDQVEYAGFVRLTRYGKIVTLKNLLNAEQHEELIQHFSKEYPNVITEINNHVQKIRNIVKKFDPLELLRYSFINYLVYNKDIVSEAELNDDQVISLRMIDYIQSVIASTLPSKKKYKEKSFVKNWKILFSEVKQLYHKINIDYSLTSTGNRKVNDPEYDLDFDAIYTQAQMLWANVRGNRYSIHNIPHLRDLFTPHNDIFQELFKISIDDFLKGIEKLQDSILKGISRAIKDFDEFRETTLQTIEKLNSDDIANLDPPAIMQKVIKKNNWQDWQDSVLGRFFGFDLFDVKKVSGLPESLLKQLSWKPGEETTFFAEGDYAGWPLRIEPIKIRPFLCIDNKYYVFETLNLMDNIYRVMQRLLWRLKPDYKQLWNERQQKASENVPFKLFKKLLPNSIIHKSVYYRWYSIGTSKKEWCETDGLVIYDDHLIIVEVKSGAFTYTPPTTDFSAYIKSIKELLLKPTIQSKRFLEYLENEKEVEIFDSNHKLIDKIKRNSFRHISACCVTIDNITTMAAKAESLKPIGVDIKEFPVWSISIDDLRVYADVFVSPATFLHFLEERQRAFTAQTFEADDEIDHLGLYMQYNRYVTLSKELYHSNPTYWHGMRIDIDKYYHQMIVSPDESELPKQKMPNILHKIIWFLDTNQKSKHSHVASILLDMDGDVRDDFSVNISNLLKKQPHKMRVTPFSLVGNTPLTVFCIQEGIPAYERGWIRDYVFAFTLRNDEPLRILLILNFDKEKELVSIDFEIIKKEDIPKDRVNEIKQALVNQSKSIISTYKKRTGKGKIGRNESCPCGSGKKYKICCSKYVD